MKTWQAGGGRADHQMGTTSVLHLASPPGYLYFHYGFTTCPPLSEILTLEIPSLVQRDSEILKLVRNIQMQIYGGTN